MNPCLRNYPSEGGEKRRKISVFGLSKQSKAKQRVSPNGAMTIADMHVAEIRLFYE